MSKIAVAASLLGLAGMAGLAAWNVSLQAELDGLREARERETDAAARDAAPVRRTEEVERPRRTDQQAVQDLFERITRLEVERAERKPAALGAMPSEGTRAHEPLELPADLPESLRSPEFERAVVAVLDARDAARRRERMESEAERMTRAMLAGLEVTDLQKADLQRVALDHLLRREAIRQNDDLPEEQKREQMKALSDEFKVSQEGILGAELVAQMDKRRNVRRADGARGRAVDRMGRRPGTSGTRRRPQNDEPPPKDDDQE